MANLLKMAISETIRTLHRRGWSQRRIADELGINRETVARHLRQADPPSFKPLNGKSDYFMVWPRAMPYPLKLTRRFSWSKRCSLSLSSFSSSSAYSNGAKARRIFHAT